MPRPYEGTRRCMHVRPEGAILPSPSQEMPLMSLDAHLTPWTGTALRHLPSGTPFNVLDFRFAGLGAENRWNAPGHPTLYLAGDEGVLIRLPRRSLPLVPGGLPREGAWRGGLHLRRDAARAGALGLGGVRWG